MKKGMLREIGFLMLALVVTTIVGCSSLTGSKATDEITVVGKNFTEQDIMANLVGVLIEKNTGQKVSVKSFLGGTDVCFNAVKNGNADAYVEYTGTGLVNIMGEKVMSDPQKVYEKVKAAFPQKYKLEWLEPIGFNNTYAIAVTQETAQKYNLKKISDLQAVANKLTFGTEQEFLERADGLKGLKETYKLNFKDAKAMDPGLKYKALVEGQVDLIDAFSTDGMLVKHNLVILEDDKNFFPPYYAAPLVRIETLKKHPELEEVLNKLAGKIDDREMATLNAQVDVEKKKAKDVAEAWLKKEGLI
ncbi:osmoprotectant transport system substrate-binding protein [Desulforamulus putei DSM 12395]|uniref:Osmoprotectant transport system substrate-binding protein n=1 Tax=Desulforamulus putei DSM 12395 TaxID=1121429 RepID=A0A1M4Y091_9FIRM|nr:glycine betaine ABC transporter substrate-binding protein [Desulforamulus putei]SHE99089.1 osmoprotectant transport system substrate-binding protein [Desulforamulus putei DSM 12395]